MTYEQYIASAIWRALREQALIRDSFRCRTCDEPDDLEVHHRRYPAVLGTETVDDLTTLCSRCHVGITSELRSRRYGSRTVVLIDVSPSLSGRIEVQNAVQDYEFQDYRRVTPAHAQWATGRPDASRVEGDAQDQFQEKED